jgi:ABC-2 type transport system ATP-binding protein
MELVVKDLQKQYGKKCALNHFNCRLKEGVNILLGPNGAGKSTLMNSLADVLPISGGTVELDGENIYVLGKQYRKRLGYLPQNPEFYPFFTGREIIEYFARLKELKKGTYDVETLLKRVNLSAAADRACGGYSGGMKRRLGIAVAMLGNPDIMIMDEPTAGLDPKERILFKRNIKQLAQDHIVIMATHIISDAEDIGSHIVMLKDGENIGEGTIEELTQAVTAATGREQVDLDDVYMHWFGEELEIDDVFI